MSMHQGLYSIVKLSEDSSDTLFADQSHPWLLKVLEELNEEFDEEDRAAIGPYIRFKGEITKVKNNRYGVSIILTGELSVRICALCGRTGQLIADPIECEVRSVFIEEENRSKYQLEDEITLLLNEDEYDLYYYSKNKCDVASVLREYAFLNKNPYPLAE
jgi:hypothetical protein